MLTIYKQEKADGLLEKLRANSFSFASSVALSDKFQISEKVLASLKNVAKASSSDFDLHYLASILVTVGWNKNDDVFDPLEVWLARHSPEHKPLNYEHDCDKIVGHIISNWGIDAEGKVIAEDTAVEDLPKKFHIATGAVLYKFWDKPELQERIDKILAEISNGELSVSMEALFKGFDYAVRAKDGSHKIITRSEKTAYLTKHLRAYGGTGVYDDCKIGRLLRNINFSGKGLVKNPANPESVIFTDSEPFVATATVQEFENRVYIPVSTVKSGVDIKMEELQKKLDALMAENEQLKASLRDNDVKAHKEAADAAKAEKAEADKLLKASNDSLTAIKAELDATKSKLTETEASLKTVNDEVAAVKAKQKHDARVAVAKDKLKLADADAETFVTANEVLADEQFDAQVAVLAKAMDALVISKPAANGSNSATPPVAPKQTPAQAPPKATSLPAPMAKGSESDDAGEAAADAANLDGVTPNVDVALATKVSDDGVINVQKQIAAYFGVKVEE